MDYHQQTESGIKGYAGTDSSRAINRSLRDGETASSGDKQTIDRLTKTLDKQSLPVDVKTYRAVRPGEGADKMFANFQSNVGATVTDKGFTSTTASKAYANKWGGEGAVMVSVQVPKGSKAMYLSDIGGRQEHEVLVQRGSKYKVLSAGVKDGVRHVSLQLL